MSSLITASYTDQFNVSFTNNAWFNATEVAKHFGKRPNDWLNLESTKEYMACLAELYLPENEVNREKPLQGKMVTVKNQLVTTVKGGKSGGGNSWFHPKLAVAFARWLDVRFSIWCDLQIERILRQPVSEPIAKDSITLSFSPPKEHEPTRQIMINIHHSGLLNMWETPPETVEEKRNLAIIALKRAGYIVIKGTLVV